MNKDVTITRKVQILFDCEKSELKAMYKKWYDWQHIVRRAANWITTHQYIQDSIKDLFYFNDEVKMKLGDIRKDENGMLTMSRDNTTYQVLSRAFKGQCPMGMLSGLNMVVSKTFKEESLDVRMGKRSLRTYRDSIPMPVRMGDVSNWAKATDGNYTFSVYGTNFKTWFGRDLSNNEEVFDRAMVNDYKMCDSSIVLRDNKMFLLAVFQFEKQEVKLDSEKAMSVTLGADQPVTITLRGHDYLVGHKDELCYQRDQIKAARQRIQVTSRYNRRALGRKKKIAVLDRFHKAEHNFVETRIHQYTAMVIDYALKHKCGVIDFVPSEVETMVPAANFTEKLKYKCAKFGIQLNGVEKKTKKTNVPARQAVHTAGA